jgi:hypothetical protein
MREAGRALDAEVERVVFGGEVCGMAFCPCGARPYSTDMGAAWAVVEAMGGRGYFATMHEILYADGRREWAVSFDKAIPNLGEERAPTPARAICLAALKALTPPEAP